MLNKKDAQELVLNFILSRQKCDINPPIIIEKSTIVLPWGWLIYYNSKEYVETGNIDKAYIGNVPYMVNKFNSELKPISFNFAKDYKISNTLKTYAKENGYNWDDSLVVKIDGEDGEFEDFDKIKGVE